MLMEGSENQIELNNGAGNEGAIIVQDALVQNQPLEDPNSVEGMMPSFVR